MRNLLVIISIALLFTNCANNNKNQNSNKEEVATHNHFQEDINSVAQEDRGSVQEINTFMRMSGASFMPEIVNNPHNVEKYKLTPYLAAANMGIYATDVLYQAAYKRTDGTMLSYGAAKDLAYHIGVGEVFDEIILHEIEEGLSKDDSVIYKLTKALDHSKTILRDKDQARLLTAITIGLFIEKLYITNNIIFNYTEDIPEESKLLVLRQSILVLAMQIKQAVELTDLFRAYKPKTEKANKVYMAMKEIAIIYAPMNLEENIQEADSKQIFENAELLKAFDKVKEVRAMIILEN